MDNNEGGYHANIVGTCFDMCPPNERQKRLNESDVHRLEQPVLDGETLQQTMVKKFQRSSADHELQIAEELRTPETLLKTVEYIENRIMELDDDRLIKYLFIWDRYRMIAKDFTLQLSSSALTDTWIECHERMARWFVFMDHDMKSYEDFVSNHGQQNGEQLNNLLKSLNTFYNRSIDISRAHQAEFLAYFILFQIGNGGEVTRFLRGVDGAVLCSKEVKAATAVWQAVKTDDIITFFRLLDKADLLQACLIHRYVAQMRTAAIKRMARSMHVSSKPSTPIPIAFIASALRFETTEETIEFLEYCGYACDGHEEVVYLDGHSVDDAFPEDKNGRPIKPIAPPMTHIMEKKISGRTIQQICHGTKVAALTTATLSLQERLKAARQKIQSSPAAPVEAKAAKRKNELSSPSPLAMAGVLGSNNKASPVAAQQQQQQQPAGPFTSAINQQQRLSSNVPWPVAPVVAPVVQEGSKLGGMFAALSQQKQQQSPQQQGKVKESSFPINISSSSSSSQQQQQTNTAGKYIPPHQRISPKPAVLSASAAVPAPSAPFQLNMPPSQAQQSASKLSAEAPSFLPGKPSIASVATPFAGFGQPLSKVDNIGNLLPLPPAAASFAGSLQPPNAVNDSAVESRKPKVISRQLSKAVAEPLSIPVPAPDSLANSYSNSINAVVKQPTPRSNERQQSVAEKIVVVPQPAMKRQSTEVSASLRTMVDCIQYYRAVSLIPVFFRRWSLLIQHERRQLVTAAKRKIFSSWKRMINESQARRDDFMQSLHISSSEVFGMRIEDPSTNDSFDYGRERSGRGNGGRGQRQRSRATAGEHIITAAAVDIPLTSFALSQAAAVSHTQDANSSRMVDIKIFSSSKACGLFSAHDCPYTAILRAMFCNVHGLLSNFNPRDINDCSTEESLRVKQVMSLWQCGKIRAREDLGAFTLAIEKLYARSYTSSMSMDTNEEDEELFVSISDQGQSMARCEASDINVIILSSQQQSDKNLSNIRPSCANSTACLVLIVPCDDNSKQSFSCHHITGYPTMESLHLALGSHDGKNYQAACHLMGAFQQQLLLSGGEDQLKEIILTTMQTLIMTVPQEEDYETLPTSITQVDQIALPTLISRLQSRPDVIEIAQSVAAQAVKEAIVLVTEGDYLREVGVFSTADWLLLQDTDDHVALHSTLKHHLQALEEDAVKEYSNWPAKSFSSRADCIEGIPNLCSVLSLPQLDVIGKVGLPYDWLTRSETAITSLMKVIDALSHTRCNVHELFGPIPAENELIYLPKSQWLCWRGSTVSSLEGSRRMLLQQQHQEDETVKMILDWPPSPPLQQEPEQAVKKRRFDSDNPADEEKGQMLLALPEKENSLAKRSRSLENEKAEIINAVDELMALLKKENRRSQLTTNFMQSKLTTN